MRCNNPVRTRGQAVRAEALLKSGCLQRPIQSQARTEGGGQLERTRVAILPSVQARGRMRPRQNDRSTLEAAESRRLRQPMAQANRCLRLLCSRPSDRRGPGSIPEAAMCVQDVDVQCVLQFTLIHAAGCALHRHTSRVIHRLELSLFPAKGRS